LYIKLAIFLRDILWFTVKRVSIDGSQLLVVFGKIFLCLMGFRDVSRILNSLESPGYAIKMDVP
jgi:hypothetical protein